MMIFMKHFSLSKTIFVSMIVLGLLACAKEGESSLAMPQDDSSIDESLTKPGSFRLDQEVKKYKDRYELNTASDKVTDNQGLGEVNLWGTRNFRVVLHGVMYRGGANNKNFEPPRSNTNPLPTAGLNNLCKEDFSAAVYLYSENFQSAPKSVNCKSTGHQDHTLNYKQFAAAGENEKILALIYDRIKGKSDGPIYAHCWNGWHSSGLIAGMALKQFCGWSNEKVDDYWMKNTDGNNQGFDKIRKKLKDFKPLVRFSISSEERKLICPEAF